MDLNKLREIIKTDSALITQHASKRMLERSILFTDIVNAISNGEIIEEYPDDYPCPSCLILGLGSNNKMLHIVCSLCENKIFIITVYEPNAQQWNADLKTRKE